MIYLIHKVKEILNNNFTNKYINKGVWLNMTKNYEELLNNKKKEILEGIRSLSFEELLNWVQDIDS